MSSQREAFRPVGSPLSTDVANDLAPHFAHPTLERIRVVEVERIENPTFYAALAARGVSLPIDFTGTTGITFVDTILVARSRSGSASDASLLFHEAVHVVQYDLLGLDGFLTRYVRGWADNGREYRRIPLERQAYDLQTRFESNARGDFQVERELRVRLMESRRTT